MSTIVSFEAGVEAVLGTFPGQAGIGRSFECFNSRVTKAFFFLAFIGQESPLYIHRVSPCCILLSRFLHEQSRACCADRFVKEVPEGEHVILPFVARFIAVP